MAIRYLKTWMGYTTSSGAGMADDGGYPELKLRLIKSLDELVSSYDPKAEYYSIEEVDVSELIKAAQDLKGRK